MLKNGKYNKPFKIAVCLFMMIIAIFLFANFALAVDVWGPDVNGTNFQATTGLSGADLRVTIAQIIRIIIGFLGIIAVVLIIYGGFIWMTSGGEPQKIEQAKQILKNAVIGLIIILFAFAIATFILNLLMGATGGVNNQAGVGPGNYGMGALGGGIIESHYPARNQKEVPRNTSIIVTFREGMDPTTLCNPVDTSGPLPKCNGGAIANNNVRIFKLSDEVACMANPMGVCPSLATAKVYSTGNKTFVFVPDSYLGSPSEYINYAVYLTTDIKKADGVTNAFGSLGVGYEWSFEVSNKIDLTPPQVKSGGVFPAPDVSQDDYTVSDAVAATGIIQVSGQPKSQRNAAVTSTIVIAGATSTTAINTNCQQDGVLNISIINSGGLVAQLYGPPPASALLGQGTFGQTALGNKTITFNECNLVLTLNSAAYNFAVGNGWNITVTKAVAADTLTVGNSTYVFGQQIAVGATLGQTAANIRTALNSNSEVSVGGSSATVTLTAKVAGAAGNNINLTTSNPVALVITSIMSGGIDKSETTKVKGRRDKPMNATIQIEFNEAIMPLHVSGTADDVKNYIRVVNADGAAKNAGAACAGDAECKSYKCSGTCVNNELKGKFEISNQYSTVNFVSDNECGFNSCGEKIYCLPADSNLRVELKAASLAACATSADCASKAPFTNCTGGVCQDGASKNYPLADLVNLMTPSGGIVDVAINSLDGNRDTFAQGPVSYYNENDLYGLCASGANQNRQCSDADKDTICGSGVNCYEAGTTINVKPLSEAQKNGDNYLWSFFINDQLDLTSPIIKLTDPIISASDINATSSILMHFNKLMMSSRLTTGSVTITNGDSRVTHQLINLRPLAQQPLAYWVTNEGVEVGPPDGEYEESKVYINHSSFSNSSTYRAQAGSGLKDVYQNCYLPSGSLDCAATLTGTPPKPSCCNGTATAGETCP